MSLQLPSSQNCRSMTNTGYLHRLKQTKETQNQREQVQGSHHATKIKFPDIPSRFLKIPESASNIFQFSGWLHHPTPTPAITFQWKYQFFYTYLVLTTAVFNYVSLHLLSVANANGVRLQKIHCQTAQFPDEIPVKTVPDFPESENPAVVIVVCS